MVKAVSFRKQLFHLNLINVKGKKRTKYEGRNQLEIRITKQQFQKHFVFSQKCPAIRNGRTLCFLIIQFKVGLRFFG